MQVEFRPHGTGLAGYATLGERPPAQEEGEGAQAFRSGCGFRAAQTRPREVVSHVAAVHLYVTDLDRSIDFYTRLLGYGPQAAYDEGENAHSAFFVLEEGGAFLVLTWDPERGREVGGGSRLELAVDDVESEVDRLRARGIEHGRKTRTRFGTDVFDVSDPDGYLVRVGPAWTLHAIEGAV
jgi:catechol 2,3-dioxygenase-like lactoylglutathione lyase family enzyme